MKMNRLELYIATWKILTIIMLNKSSKMEKNILTVSMDQYGSIYLKFKIYIV